MVASGKLKAPFPFFGGKSKVAPIIWQGLGEVTNYIEPFAGSLAVLLNNPKPSKIETVNDIDCFITNFWRAISKEPEAVAKWADEPVHQADLHARHRWLVSSSTDDFRLRMNTDPDYYDVKIAGWWVWGMGASIPGNWLQQRGLNAMPLLSSGGGGVHGLTANVPEWFNKLQERLRKVRVCCGDWSKVLSPAVSFKSKALVPKDITGVFLDPPYDLKSRVKKIYQTDNDIFSQVCQWAIENGDNPKMRIVLCGYEGDHGIPDTWKTFSWQGNGLGNKSNGKGKENLLRERIYFSPYCHDIK